MKRNYLLLLAALFASCATQTPQKDSGVSMAKPKDPVPGDPDPNPVTPPKILSLTPSTSIRLGGTTYVDVVLSNPGEVGVNVSLSNLPTGVTANNCLSAKTTINCRLTLTASADPNLNSFGNNQITIKASSPGIGWSSNRQISLQMGINQAVGTGSGDAITKVIAADDGVYVAGTTKGTFAGYTNSGGDDAFIAKYSPLGALLWAKQFGTSSDDVIDSFELGIDGVYVAGSGYIKKYDFSGAEKWSNKSESSLYSLPIFLDPTGLYVLRYISSSRDPFYGGTITKLDFINGDTIYSKSIDSHCYTGFSDSVVNGISDLAIRTGFYLKTAEGLTKCNFDGLGQWNINLESAVDKLPIPKYMKLSYRSHDLEDYAFGADDSIYILGDEIGTAIDDDPIDGSFIFLTKLDTNGNIKFYKIFDNEHNDRAYEMQVTSNGIYIRRENKVGYFFLTKFDLDGNAKWSYSIANNTKLLNVGDKGFFTLTGSNVLKGALR